MKLNRLLISFFLLYTGASYALSFPQGIYAGIEGGYDWSHKLNLQPPANEATCIGARRQACWDNSHQSFAAPLGNAGFWGARAGYRINHFLMADVSYNLRNHFAWDQISPADINPHARHRYITDIRNQTVLFNLYVTPNLQWARLDPYLEGGVGSAWNKVGELTSANLTTGIVSRITGDTTNSFAWQVGAGLNYYITPHIFADGGYRFWDLGKFRTGTIVQVVPPASIARLQANHAYVNEAHLGINYIL